MGDLSQHFDNSEFKCSCCGKTTTISSILIERLEQLYSLMGAKAIYINSGYRCNNNPWGSITDAHRKGIAADIKVQRKNGSYYTAADIAEAAERIGFGGIGIMEPDSCHVDTRDSESYINSHWYGNETTGNDYINSFQRDTIFDGDTTQDQTHEIEAIITIEGKKYTGLLTEE